MKSSSSPEFRFATFVHYDPELTATGFHQRMRVYVSHALAVFAVVGLLSCEHTPPTSPWPTPPPLEPALDDLRCRQIDYLIYSIRHASGKPIVTTDIIAVTGGTVESGTYTVRDSVRSQTDDLIGLNSTEVYLTIPFSMGEEMITFRIRYHRVNGGWDDVDTTLSTMTYPYPGTEIVWVTEPSFFEDVDVVDSIIYGQDNDRVGTMNMRTGETSFIYVPSYEAITVAEHRYLIFDHFNWSLYRYDMVTESLTMFAHHAPYRFLLGLEWYENSIYELLAEPSAQGHSLLKYSLSGEILDSTYIPPLYSRLTIFQGIAYMQGSRGVIARYNLVTGDFLPAYKAPSLDYEGLRIREGYLYFSDYRKKVIARFPYEELEKHGTVDP